MSDPTPSVVPAPSGSPESGSAPVAASALTRADVVHLAHLARLELTDTELDLYLGQLTVVLDSVAVVTEVATADIVPTTHAVPLTNVYRPDVLRPGLSREAALAGAPAAQDGQFRVPQILGEGQ